MHSKFGRLLTGFLVVYFPCVYPLPAQTTTGGKTTPTAHPFLPGISAMPLDDATPDTVPSKEDFVEPPYEIIRLPKYVVRPDDVPEFTERELFGTQGRLTIAQRRYIASFNRRVLNRFRLPIIGGGIDQYALQMYEDDERLRQMARFNETVLTYRLSGDEAAAAEFRTEVQQTFMRRSSILDISRRRHGMAAEQ